ncbi:MgtC/SapB family protein [Butyrivibrio sp. FCS014]|uniref:MgtC/SapB family protein n=1 Tax=Butyrivibrio sp. FCS014 TaxID=1408304 RepID=UPI000463F681|nr:MgtC/SapB family protein [Butyrivibrio sp. FCS014]
MSFSTILEFLQGNSDIAVAIRLFLATVFGSVVGWERIARHHNAGIKTFALVSLGSAVATALNIYLAILPGLNADVSRIPAGVVSGIGFLGAGTILVTGRKQIKGLSTAATLWVTSCMGMAIGAGYLVVGIVCFLLVAFSNLVLMQFSNHVEQNSRYMSIYIEVSKSHGVTKLTKWMEEQGFLVVSMTKSKEKTLQASDTGLMIDLDFGKKLNHNGLINMISEQEYVNYVEEV